MWLICGIFVLDYVIHLVHDTLSDASVVHHVRGLNSSGKWWTGVDRD